MDFPISNSNGWGKSVKGSVIANVSVAMSKSKREGDPEIATDAWERFERAVATVAKAPPQHRAGKPESANRKGGALKTRDGRPKKGA